MERKTRVRFAPSPTGPLHMGGVRTALYNYLFAKQRGGDFIIRIEDTDSQRFVPGAEKYIIEALNWCGIIPDEGVDAQGNVVETASERHPHAPYRQSQRKPIYRQYAEQLVADGFAYYAFDTAEELGAKRAEMEAAGQTFIYGQTTRMGLRNSLSMPEAEWKALLEERTDWTIRFKMPENRVVAMDDLIRGHVEVNTSTLDDKVLWKRADELPTYHLANIVDDHLMEVTHVIRGEEWLPSAPLHVLLYEAFGWADTMPRFAHLPLLLKPVGNGKLSKRDGDKLGFPVFPLEWHDPKSGEISSGYREKGYLPEAVVNFLALLGWNPGNDQEVMSMDELIRLFDLTKCSKSGARFDYVKGIWFNHQYLLKQDDMAWTGEFDKILRAEGIESTPEREAQVVAMMKQKVVEYTDNDGNKKKRNVSFVSDLWPLCKFFFVAPEAYDKEDKFVRKNWKEDTAADMMELVSVLEKLDDFSVESQKAVVDPWTEETGKRPWNAWRVALVGTGQGPDMYELSAFLGKDETIARIKKACECLK